MSIVDLASKQDYHPLSEELVKVLQQMTQNDNPDFFRIIIAFYFGVVASMMRTTIETQDKGSIPVNSYAINLGVSGMGKGLSTSFIEEELLKDFFYNFKYVVMPRIAERNIAKLAVKRGRSSNEDVDDYMNKLMAEYAGCGSYFMVFDEATEPAIKQLRHKLLLADAGSINLIVDEFGTQLSSIAPALTSFLEMYDIGRIKPKLTKSTKESLRTEDIDGRTPANMLLFGTPGKVLDGSKTEEEFRSWLDTGFARRCLFALVSKHSNDNDLTAEEIFEAYTSDVSSDFVKEFASILAAKATEDNMYTKLKVTREVSIMAIEYRLECEERANNLGEFDDMQKAELSHRYFKAMKTAGSLAFVDGNTHVTEENLLQAIKLTEDSGEAFVRIIKQERNYARVARYIATAGRDLTIPDLVSDLPFFPTTNAAKNDIITLAIAYGYQNSIIIKKHFVSGIEFLRGETLKETNLDEITVSYSNHHTEGFSNDVVKFSDFSQLSQKDGYGWCNHHFESTHRSDEFAKQGFNLIVLDVDGTATVQQAAEMFKDYEYHIYTTKSFTPEEHRFRIVIPTNYILNLDSEEFKEFMQNIYSSLPFKVDDVTGQRSRFWASHAGNTKTNHGKLFDVLPYIPKTSLNEERKQLVKSQAALDGLERWFVNNTGEGNRNSQLYRYASVLVEYGETYQQIYDKVCELNDKIGSGINKQEIEKTIMVSVKKKLGI